MPIDTNLNISPYYDDFDVDKNYHRVLFRPGVAVQARELTQLQTILQNQIERFGDNVFKTGTIIKGCSLTTDYSYYYVKLLDTQVDGQPTNPSGYANTLIVQEASGLSAYVVNYRTGYESLDPNLNTLYLKYLNTGSGGQKTFANNQVLTVYDRNRTVEKVTINNGGTLYSNSDVIVFTASDSGSGAVAEITTDATGTITDVSITSKGTQYVTAPTVSVTTSTGVGADLTALNYIAQIIVAGDTFTAPVGIGAAVKSSDGIIYQKGNFIRVDQQEEILQKYSSSPDDVVVGFRVVETIANSNVDDTLLDLALGTPNYTAPGAHRLELTPALTVLTKAQAAANNEFLALLEYENGNVVKDRTTTQFNSVNKELARRTYEESGNYVLTPFQLNTLERSGNSTHFDLSIGPGVGYVNGNRIEILNNSKLSVRKGNDTSNNVNHTTSTSYGSYVLVKELLGAFEIKTGSTVTLRDTAGTDVTDNAGGSPTAPGTTIGTAKVKSIEYSSGTIGTPDCQYKLYLFDVKMSSSRSFTEVKSIIISGTAIADIVLTNGKAVLQDVETDRLVFNSGVSAVKEFTQEEYYFRTSTNATFTTSGNVTISYSGGNTLPYSGVLSDTLKNQFIIIPTQSIYADSSSLKTGTVTVSATNVVNVVGTSTLFTTEYAVGDYISIGTSTPYRISTIYNDNLLALSTAFGSIVTANTHKSAYPANVPIDFTRTGKVINVTSDTTVLVNLGHAINSTATFTMYHELKSYEPAVRAKTVNNPVYIKLSTDKLANTTTGPWCLGIPDVFSIEAVYVGTSNSYSESTTNYATQFDLETGQKDNYYGLSYIRKKPGSSISLSSSSCLLVKVKSFSHSSGKYISTESYPIDDTTTPLPADKIRSETIPYYVSPSTGEVIILSDAIDTRPIVANTAVLSSTAAGASIDPSSTETLTTGEKYFPSPINSFQSTVQSYLPRVDRVVLSEDGLVRIVEGISSISPSAPPVSKGTMDIGTISIAPYPSLSAKQSSDAGRPDLSTKINLLQTKRYTMKDIGDLENRINQLEYITLLNAVESNTVNITIPSEANTQIERFKNGFIVDPFNNYNISNLSDGEYKALIDRSKLSPQYSSAVIDVTFDSTASSGVVKTGDLITLNYAHKEMFSQPVANKERTLVEEYWKFAGKMQVVPEFDNYFDTTTTATSAISVDIATPMQDLVNAVNDALKNVNLGSTTVSSTNDYSALLARGGNWNQWLSTTTTTTTDRYTGINANVPTVTNIQEVGSFLTDFTLNQYIREQQIAFYASGLRPGATHYVYFDSVNLSANCRPAEITSFTDITKDNFKAIGVLGGELTANASGEIAVLLNIPGGVFTTGERDILVMDVDNLISEESATSKALGKFSAFNFSGDKTRVTFSTKSFKQSTGSTFSSNTYSVTKVSTSTRTWTQRWDPLAQTFTVQKQDGGDLVYLTKVDLFFKAKDDTTGVSIELRETDESGYPTDIIIPFSVVHKASSEVNVSPTANTATTFTFPSPVGLRVGKDYALVMTPDANSPEYRIWTGQTGIPDVTNTSLISNESWGLGTLFYSVSGKAFTPVQNEDIKFNMYRADFTNNMSGTVTVKNGDYEFLTVANTTGSFKGGEDVVQMSNSYINSTLTTNTASRVITTSTNLSSTLSTGDYILIVYGTGQSQLTANVKSSGTTLTNATSTGASFTTDFANGDFIRVGSEIRQVVSVTNDNSLKLDVAPASPITSDYHYTVVPVYDVLRVDSANSTSITVNKAPSANTSTTLRAGVQKTVRGVVSVTDPSNNKLYLSNSTSANSSFLLKTANSTYLGLLIGDDSQATSKISSIDNLSSVVFTPLINTLITSGTTSSFTATLTLLGGGTSTENYSLVATNRGKFNDSAVIKSKTNEISGTAINKSFVATLGFSTGYKDTSPVIDINPSSIIINSYKVNNDSTNENTRYGNAQCKYITKRLALADQIDAEDIKVYVNAYKPLNTNIKVYAKILNGSDGEVFDDKDWSELDQITPSGVYSSTLNENDVREYQYGFKYSPTSTILAGKVTAQSNTTLVGSNTTFTSLTAGDLIKVVRTSSTTDYDIIPVASVANTTQLTLASNVSFSAAGCTIEKVTNPKQAFKYCRNSNTVRYYDSSKAAYDTYKYVAIKIVLLSSMTYIVPKLTDVRAIACSV